MDKKEADKQRKAEISKAAQEAGLLKLTIHIAKSDKETVLELLKPYKKDPNPDKKKAGRKPKILNDKKEVKDGNN